MRKKMRVIPYSDHRVHISTNSPKLHSSRNHLYTDFVHLLGFTANLLVSESSSHWMLVPLRPNTTFVECYSNRCQHISSRWHRLLGSMKTNRVTMQRKCHATKSLSSSGYSRVAVAQQQEKTCQKNSIGKWYFLYLWAELTYTMWTTHACTGCNIFVIYHLLWFVNDKPPLPRPSSLIA